MSLDEMRKELREKYERLKKSRENPVVCIPPDHVYMEKGKSGLESMVSKEDIASIANEICYQINKRYDKKPITLEDNLYIAIRPTEYLADIGAIGAHRRTAVYWHSGPAIVFNRDRVDKDLSRWAEGEGWTKREVLKYWLGHELVHHWLAINGIRPETLEMEKEVTKMTNEITGLDFEPWFMS